MYQNTSGQILGATTLVAGMTSLPYTGGNHLGTVLSFATILTGGIVLVSFIVIGILRKKLL